MVSSAPLLFRATTLVHVLVPCNPVVFLRAKKNKERTFIRLPWLPWLEEEEEEFNRLPWLGQCGRAAAGCACTAAALRC
jgi:hypothetical protein